MNTVITINGNANSDENYVTWSPEPARIQLMEPGAAASPVRVRLKNQQSAGRPLSFFLARNDNALNELELDLPTDGSPVDFFVAGKFDEDNMTDYDAKMEVIKDDGGNTLSTVRAFVRVRRNANKLSEAERDLFLSAIATLNNSGNGLYEQFRDMHDTNSLSEAHEFSGFLPWHRAYLLHLERALQKIEPSVALHYWRFDEAAPNIFSKEFMGVSDENGTVEFVSAHPFEKWIVDGVPGINRKPRFNAQQSLALHPIRGPVISELATLAQGGSRQLYKMFQTIEKQPHNRAHNCFEGMLNHPVTAPKDPLFFLLHSNVDRLWALWQVLNKRFDNSRETYSTQGIPPRFPGNIGHELNDTMWPWNLDTNPPRPSTAIVPGGSFFASSIASITAPRSAPKISDMIDYQGIANADNCLGFDYDVVPFGKKS